MKIKTCLISVYEKKNVVDLAKMLVANDVQIISTGGTAVSLKKHGIKVISVEEITDFPEILDGRVKTLHPKIHGGILAQRNNNEHMTTLENHKIGPIDIVVSNLYPFKEKKEHAKNFEEIIENIDIGGSTLVRAAAKNFQNVLVLTDPDDYHLIENGLITGSFPIGLKIFLAHKAFEYSKKYESEIQNFFYELNRSTLLSEKQKHGCPVVKINEKNTFELDLKKFSNLRYGENPHQSAAVFVDSKNTNFKKLISSNLVGGKELSFNNIIDADTASNCVEMLDNPACVIVKHANPCGVAEDVSCLEAFKRAKLTDPISSFGGIIAFNREVDENLANIICEQFAEVVIASSFSRNASKILSNKPNLRLITRDFNKNINDKKLEIKTITDGYLIQESDDKTWMNPNLNFVTKIRPDNRDITDLRFAWLVASWVKSNAIVFCRDSCTLGIGAGQMSRIDSVNLAIMKASQSKLSLSNSVVASDAFFPFRDGIDLLCNAGAKSVIQPGGSIRDIEVIKAANEQNISMVFTGVRHFRH